MNLVMRTESSMVVYILMYVIIKSSLIDFVDLCQDGFLQHLCKYWGCLGFNAYIMPHLLLICIFCFSFFYENFISFFLFIFALLARKNVSSKAVSLICWYFLKHIYCSSELCWSQFHDIFNIFRLKRGY